MTLERSLKKWLLLPLAMKYVWMPGRSYRGPAPDLTAEEVVLRECAFAHVEMLASKIGERHFGKPEGLASTVAYICQQLDAIGLAPTMHTFSVPLHGAGINIIAELPGRTKRTVVVGAHYDGVANCKAANDNGSGVAALLELARLLKAQGDFELTIRFVWFGNEEHLGAPAEQMGSYSYARQCKQDNDDIVGMWSLETIGYFTDDPDSQHYPSPFDLFYPTRGNFLAFIGNEQSASWIRESLKAFRKAATLPSEGVAAPQKFKDVERSDHWSFQQFGYPALMVTDTANFRYQHYHSSADTIEQLNYTQLARVISGLAAALTLITRRR